MMKFGKCGSLLLVVGNSGVFWEFNNIQTSFQQENDDFKGFPKKLLFVGIWDPLNLMESLRFSHSKRLGPVSGGNKHFALEINEFDCFP